ncbi:neuraminidase-like domain-containing protein [Pseudomonas lini]
MTTAIKKQLDENLRDALLALYLNKVAPVDPMTKTLKSARDLYEYWLLDVLVSQDVPTTPVACGIASLQQYINRILMNMEPGYDSANITPERLQTWRNELHQYPAWAAHQKLLYFPSIYLHPNLRNNKSDNFQTLENKLSQNRIKPDAVQAAVLSYLTRFEEVANLNILNGYIDGTDFANSTYYFIAKSRSDQTYFWRSLNMAQRPSKRDQPDPHAWSDWEKADVPISDDAIEHSIRPVWFNNRLFVVWAECLHQDSAAHFHQNQATRNNPLFRLHLSYRKHDGSWSTARSCLQGYSDDNSLDDMDLDSIKSMTGTVAIVDQENSEELFIALYVNQLNKAIDQFVFLRTVNIDKNLIHTPGASPLEKNIKNSQEHPHYTLTKHFSKSLNKGSLQLKVSKAAKDAALDRAKIAELDKSKYANTYPLNDIFYIDASYTQNTNKITIQLSTTEKKIDGYYIVIRPKSERSSEHLSDSEPPLETTLFKYNIIGFDEDGETFHCGVKIIYNGVTSYRLASIKLSFGNDFRTPYIGYNGTAQFLKFSIPQTHPPLTSRRKSDLTPYLLPK